MGKIRLYDYSFKEGFSLFYKESLPIDITWLSLKDAIKAFKSMGNLMIF